MPKYVCDFDVVTEVGQSICSVAEDMDAATNNYAGEIDSIFTADNWSGASAEKFKEFNEEQIQSSKLANDDLYSLGEYIQEVSKGIQEIEDELAALNI